MKMGKTHDVPLSDQALAILRRQHESAGRTRTCSPADRCRSLSNMALAMLLRRLNIDATVHGMRAARGHGWPIRGCSSRSLRRRWLTRWAVRWCQAYQRSSMLELRRPILQRWADFICPADNVVDIKRGAA